MIEYKRIFLDTAPVIYYLQKHDTYYTAMKEFLYNSRLSGAKFVSSDITIAEYLVKPYRDANTPLIVALGEFLRLANVEIAHTTEQVAHEAAKIRAEYIGFKAMDSFQLAMAVENNCDLFLTNDKQLRRFKDITCVTLENI